MLILIPPSEGKREPPAGADRVDLDALAFARELSAVRARLLDGTLRAAPAAPAADVYSGVLYARLGLAGMTPAARARAEARVLIFSAQWGLLRPGDRIPAYRREVRAGDWREAVGTALAPLDLPDELVVDCRSGPYAAMWRPETATHVAVRAFREHPDGSRQAISHMAKATRGDVARALLRSRRASWRPRDVLRAAQAAGLRAELGELGDGRRLALDVVEPA